MILWQCTETLIADKQDVCHTANILTELDKLIHVICCPTVGKCFVIHSTAHHSLYYILQHISKSIVCK
jgi:hypothetical protein